MSSSLFFFFNDTATTEIYTLSLHDALPIFACPASSHTVESDVLRSARTRATAPESMGVSTARCAASRVAASRRTAVQRSMDDLDGTGDGVVDHRAPNGGMCRGAERLQRGRGSSGGTSVRLQLPPAGW